MGGQPAPMSDRLADLLDRRLAETDRELLERFPGDSGTRQPVHTVYVPGDRFTAQTPARLMTASSGAGFR